MIGLTEYIKHLIAINRLDKFYHSKEWNALKRKVLKQQHYECQRCKEKHHRLTILRLNSKSKAYYINKHGQRISRPLACVHHVKEVKKYPQLALSLFYIDDSGVKQRQLIALCPQCHNEVHNRFQNSSKIQHFVNEERW